MYKLTPAQCKAARAMLEWTQKDLAVHSKVGLSTISDFEAKNRKPHFRTVGALEMAFEKAGIRFFVGGVQRDQRR
jgi:transcriptional regulator with XRE-family HTH domain